MKSDSEKQEWPPANSANVTTPDLTAKNLKSALWETLNKVKGGEMEAGQADSIASQAREILRTTNTQLRIAQQAKRSVSVDVIRFAEE